jgi:TPR repeat protein
MREKEPSGWGSRRRLLLSVGLAFALGFAIAVLIFSPSLRSRIQTLFAESEETISDYYKAPIELIESRAEGGDLVCQKVLFHRYSNPLLGKLDLTNAEKWKKSYVSEVMKRAASGDAASQLILSGELRYGGPFFLKDEVEGLNWLIKSATAGSMEARYTLAQHYRIGTHIGEGDFVGQNKALALKLYVEIAKTYDPQWHQRPEAQQWAANSQNQLIEILEFSGSPMEAYAWYAVYFHLYGFRDKDDWQSSARSNRIRKRLSNDQVASAQQLSKEILAEIDAKKSNK